MRMTSRERVRKAIHFEGPDHIPHYLPDGGENDILWLWFPKPSPIQDWTNVGDNDEMIDCWGTKFRRVAGGRIGRGEVLDPVLPDITKQALFEIPEFLVSEYFEDAIRQIKENAASSNPKYVLAVMPYASLNEGTHNLMGIQNMFLAYYDHPDDLKTFIGRLAAKQQASIRILADMGCDGVMGYDDWGLQDRLMVGMETIETFFMPYYEQNWQLAHTLGMEVWLHSCGHITALLPRFIAAGLDVVQMDQQENMGLENLDAYAGGRIAFWCPVDIQRTMVNGTPDDVVHYVRRMIGTIGAHNGGLISMAYTTPDDVQHSAENMTAMCQAFRTCGIYAGLSVISNRVNGKIT